MCFFFRKTIKKQHDRLEQARTLEECTFIYYELCRLHLELKQYELARLYGRKCVSEAYRCGSINWVINAKMLLARADIQQRNRNDARTSLNELLQIANKLNNQSLLEYIERVCLKNITNM